MKICFHVNDGKPRARSARAVLAAVARRLGLKVVVRGMADAVIALGGDGTILHAVHRFPAVPVLGFNLGSLGYLSGVGEGDFEAALEKLAAGRYRLAERTMIELRAARGGVKARALNDIVFERELTGRAAVLELAVDGKAPTRYVGDGLVVATPTGSTAYSLSAGGPVVMPDSRSLVVTPMNPHALGVRPLVVGDEVALTVTARRRRDERSEKIGVYADGEHVMMLAGDESLRLVKAATGARFVELDGYDPYAVLARKLGWTGGGER